MEPALSICSIVKNEKEQIAELVGPLKKTDIEWIVVDTGSTDGTQKELCEWGVNPFEKEWNDDFSQARNYGLSKAQAPWVLWLDADDRIDNLQWQSLLNQLPFLNKNKAYSCVVKNPMEEGEGESFRQIRLFPNFKNIEFRGRVHEELAISCRENGVVIESLDFEIIHQGYYFRKDRFLKRERNFSLLEKQFIETPDDSFVCLEFGNALFQQKKYSKALSLYEKALDSFDHCKGSALDSLYLLIANTYQHLNVDKCLDWYKKSIAWAPEYLSAYFEAGKLCLKKGAVTQAKDFFEQLLQERMHINHLAESQRSLRVNSASFLALIYWQEQNRSKALAVLEEFWDPQLGLGIDPWVPLEISFEIKDANQYVKWKERLGVKAQNNLQIQMDAWCLSSLEKGNQSQYLGTRKRWQEIVDGLKSHQDSEDLWKELKILVEKFDNYQRTVDALVHRGISRHFVVEQLRQRESHAEYRSQNPQ